MNRPERYGAAVATLDPAKQAAITQWTADPCGPATNAEPGTRPYAEELLRGRAAYAQWFDEALDYDSASDLDVLDVGCGQGIDLIRYAIAGARATGVDLTPRHVELARAHVAALGLEAAVEEGDAEALHFPDAQFDRVSSNGVLHHTPNFDAALREIHRVLRPGGETRVIVYNRNSFHYWISQVFWQGIVQRQLLEERSMAGVLSRNVEYSTIGARPLVRVYSPRQVRKALERAGFTSVTTSKGVYNVDDTPITAVLARRFPKLKEEGVLIALGRVAGWYVVGRGRRP